MLDWEWTWLRAERGADEAFSVCQQLVTAHTGNQWARCRCNAHIWKRWKVMTDDKPAVFHQKLWPAHLILSTSYSLLVPFQYMIASCVQHVISIWIKPCLSLQALTDSVNVPRPLSASLHLLEGCDLLKAKTPDPKPARHSRHREMWRILTRLRVNSQTTEHHPRSQAT